MLYLHKVDSEVHQPSPLNITHKRFNWSKSSPQNNSGVKRLWRKTLSVSFSMQRYGRNLWKHLCQMSHIWKQTLRVPCFPYIDMGQHFKRPSCMSYICNHTLFSLQWYGGVACHTYVNMPCFPCSDMGERFKRPSPLTKAVVPVEQPRLFSLNNLPVLLLTHACTFFLGAAAWVNTMPLLNIAFLVKCFIYII